MEKCYELGEKITGTKLIELLNKQIILIALSMASILFVLQ